jgi:hypothetical protein
MPSDSNGVYSLPAGYLATDGNTIQASQHNPPLEDIAAAITGRLPRNGNAAMTGALKLPDGTVGAPALTFSSATTVGFFKSTNGVAVTVNGVQVFEFSAIPQGVPVGLIGDWGGGTAPTGWLFCRGQSLLRVSYPALFTAIATVHGAVDADHFSLPNLECCVTAGLDADARGILTGATVLGALVGGQSATLVPSNLPPYPRRHNQYADHLALGCGRQRRQWSSSRRRRQSERRRRRAEPRRHYGQFVGARLYRHSAGRHLDVVLDRPADRHPQ